MRLPGRERCSCRVGEGNVEVTGKRQGTLKLLGRARHVVVTGKRKGTLQLPGRGKERCGFWEGEGTGEGP